MKREEILKEAEGLVNGPRAKDYGDADVNHMRIARLWSVILEKEVTVEQVYLCLVQLKVSRLIENPYHTDSWVDICGYAALAGED
jgi:hypothetical protein|tara:strand:- start:232 stop:486 length:255 start_codon:yes stop_codon:yes gene_type:complete